MLYIICAYNRLSICLFFIFGYGKFKMSVVDFDKINDVGKFIYCFSKKHGFGDKKDEAIILLSKTIEMLNFFSIDYFIISGTLLGYVRHNDLIQWDDDLDIIVDSIIITKLNDISEKFPELTTHRIYKNLYKINLTTTKLINKHKNVWPFIDMFIFEKKLNEIFFFQKYWDTNKFFPATPVNFLNIPDVKIPCDPNYFLEKNYGTDYMTKYISSNFDHQNERRIILIGSVSREKYNELAKKYFST